MGYRGIQGCEQYQANVEESNIWQNVERTIVFACFCLITIVLSTDQFAYAATEFGQFDEQEEDDDAQALAELAEGDEEEEEEEEGGVKKRNWGETKHYCPVALKEDGILRPGNPENCCKYRDVVYNLSSVEAQEKFLASPMDYLPSKEHALVCHFKFFCVQSEEELQCAVSIFSPGFAQYSYADWFHRVLSTDN